MAQEIVRWCDSHITRDDERVPASEYDVVIRRLGDPFAFVSVDLCEACAKPIGDLLVELVELGRPFDEATLAQVQAGAGKPRKSAAAASRVVASSTARSSAPIRGPQAGTLDRYGAALGADGLWHCPACEYTGDDRKLLQQHTRAQHELTLGELLGGPLDYACGVDGCERRFTSPQGRAVHRSRGHGSIDGQPVGGPD